jgi:Reverse transcriptase (RNA-dependent DNA polymerase)
VQKLGGMNFTPLKHAESAFITKAGQERILMLVYVDDMLLITTCKQLLKKMKAELASAYKIQDLGPVKYFLGVQIRRDSGDITLSQSGYIRDILEKHGMQDCKSALTPMDPGQYLLTQST